MPTNSNDLIVSYNFGLRSAECYKTRAALHSIAACRSHSMVAAAPLYDDNDKLGVRGDVVECWDKEKDLLK